MNCILTYLKKHLGPFLQRGSVEIDKYSELKNSWGYRSNSNYLLASVVIGKSTYYTCSEHTFQLQSVQTHQTCACSCVLTCTCPHTAYHIWHTHTHSTCTASVHTKQTQQARTIIHTTDTQRNSFVCLGPYAVASIWQRQKVVLLCITQRTIAEDDSKYQRWALSFPLLERAGTP